MKTYKVEVTKEVTRWHNESNQRHREDGPAVEYADGDKEYYINGKLHREDGPAVECANGYKEYYINNKLHREDGPAVERADGTKTYYINGKIHRENGPAVERADGVNSYYINGEELAEEEFNNRNKSCENKVIEIDGVKYKLEKL